MLAGDDPFAAIARHRASIVSLVPAQLRRRSIAAAPDSLRIVLLGGAAPSPGLVAEARALGWPLRLTYGLTEACSQVATQREGPPRTSADDFASGPPLDGVEVRSVDGRLEIRGPSLLSGYFTESGLLAPRDSEGWFRTGDLGHLDSRGHLVVLGRSDDAIVTGGEKVAPLAVERVLAACPGISEACVFGDEDAVWGEVVAAMVARGPQAVAKKSCAERRRGSHLASGRVAYLEALPLLPAGKLDRTAVRGLALPALRPLRGA